MWRAFLNYIHEQGGWEGPPPAWDTHADVAIEDIAARDFVRGRGVKHMNSFAKRMEKVTRKGLGGSEVEVNDEHDDEDREEEVNVDRPWREME